MTTTLTEILAEEAAAVSPPSRPESRDGNECVTPNGTHITFHEKPHRHYKVNGQPVASVTQVLDCIDKPALKWWGMKIGVAGVIALEERGVRPLVADVPTIVDALTAEKLTVNHVRREAADRGLRVHDALEAWARTGLRPDPFAFPEDERGYVKGLLAFIDDVRPEPDGIEIMVGSVAHKFAGRCDLLRANVPQSVEAILTLDSKTGEETRGTLPHGRYLFDLKTSASVYDEAFLQVEGYEGASVECGYEPTDRRAIVRVSSDGRYEVVISVATYDDFLAARHLFGALRRLKEARAA